MTSKKISALLLALSLVFCCISCDDGSNNNDTGNDGISWDTQANGTLTVKNNTSKDMVLFQGTTVSLNNILGGVKALTERKFDVSDAADFETGGYMVLRGITIDEYTANKSNLNSAKVEYSALAVYGKGKNFIAEISAASVGDYCFIVTNSTTEGLELRKGAPEGEKIAYIPQMATNYTVYANSSDTMTIYPAYISWNNTTKTLTTITATSVADSVTVSPKPITSPDQATYTFSGFGE